MFIFEFCRKKYMLLRRAFSHVPKSFFKTVENFSNEKKKILLVSHELSLTGAPVVLLNIAKILKKNGFSVAVISYRDGQLKKKFEEEDIPVCISLGAQIRGEEIKQLAKLFDLAIVNTIVTYRTLWYIQQVCKAVWLIHESKHFETPFLEFNKTPKYGCPGIVDVLAQCSDIYTVSEYSKSVFDKYSGNIRVIHNGFEKSEFTYKILPKHKFTFLFVGKVSHRKAADVFVEAVLELSDDVRAKAEFIVVGDINDVYAKKLIKKSRKYIQWMGVVSDKNEMSKLYHQADLLVCVSRDDTAPLVVAEAASYGVPSVISENVGSTYLIENNKSGFIIPTDNVSALKNVLEKVINTPGILDGMGINAYQKYLETSTMEKFEENFLKIVNEKLLSGVDNA